MNKRRSCARIIIALITVTTTDLRAQDAIKYESVKLRSYSRTELLELLTERSVRANIPSGRIVSVFPRHADSRVGFTRIQHDPEHVATIRVDAPDSISNYLDHVASELVRRGTPAATLLQVFDTTSDPIQFRWLEQTLARMRSRDTDRLMQSLLKSGTLDTEKSFLVLMYFAKTGTVWALRELNCNYSSWPVSSEERADLALLFGVHRYTPAGPNLVESLDAASMQLIMASLSALSAMYSDSTSFQTLREALQYWRTRLPNAGEC